MEAETCRCQLEFYLLGAPVYFSGNDIAGTVPVAAQEDAAQLDFGSLSTVRFAQVEHVDAAVVGQGHDRLRRLLVPTAPDPAPECRPCPYKLPRLRHFRSASSPTLHTYS